MSSNKDDSLIDQLGCIKPFVMPINDNLMPNESLKFEM